MIKIEIPDRQIKKNEYLACLKPKVKERLELLKYSIKHLKGDPIDIQKGNISKFKNITWKIVNSLTEGKEIRKGDFAKNKYEATVEEILEKRKPESHLDSVNFNGVLELIEELLDEDAKLLAEILVCEPDQLITENNRLLSKHNLSVKAELYILQRGFDYWLDSVAGLIKSFFRRNNFVNFCPYCNLTEVEYNETEGGSGATTHELDHFYDKESYPLLACSFFNLVPSDGTCNGMTNKGSIKFTDEFHLNPYKGGFVREFVFIPILKGNNVHKIDYDIRARKGTSIRRQMFGRHEELHEDRDTTKKHEEGNVNVFTLYSKYRCRIKKAQIVIDDVVKADKGKRAIKKFLNKMNQVDTNKAYISWYESTIKTPFNPGNFNEESYSKFNRDIHDYYYNNDSKTRNNYIRNMIQ